MGFIERHNHHIRLGAAERQHVEKRSRKAVVERGEIKRSYLVPLEAGPNTRRPRSPAMSPHGANKLISLLTEIHSDIRQIKTDLQ